MYTHIVSKIGNPVTGSTLRAGSLLLLICLAFGVINKANAVPTPPTGYGPDTGASYFTPGDEVLGFELFDLLEPATSVGFFFASDPGTTISLFDSADPSGGGGPQVTYINFVVGQVWDVDSGLLVPENFFTPKAEDIGFYLSIGGTTIYSDPTMNILGLDLFSAFPSMTESDKWAFIFEGLDSSGAPTPINLTLVSNISVPTPEPSIVALIALGVPLLLMSSRRRRKIV